MDITAIYSSTQTQFAKEIDEDNKRRESRSAPSGSRGDTVAFSDQGRELAAELAAELAELAVREEIEKNRQALAAERNSADNAPAGATGSKGANGGSSSANLGADIGADSGDDTSGQIEKLQAQIRQISQQVNSIMSGAGTPEEKSVRSTPLQQQIGVLEQQLQELQAQKRKEAMQAMQSA